MNRGSVYVWIRDLSAPLCGRAALRIVDLPRLQPRGHATTHLSSAHVRVRNGGSIYVPDGAGGRCPKPIGNAQPDADGDFLFNPGRGGGRIDKVDLADADFRDRYLQASHFGEVNTYYHLELIAQYVHELLEQLGAPALPPVLAVVTAHNAGTECKCVSDGLQRGDRWLPFQGGHYRLPSKRYDVPENEPIAVTGEIHLGPGRQLTEQGDLPAVAGGRYRCNASHNAGIIYHEYGHHITRHTADFRANGLRDPLRQDNRKPAIDEGTCDYWTAAMLGIPHIWAWHRHPDHPRNLASTKSMADFDEGDRADPHANGTIWGAALWDIRTSLAAHDDQGARHADLLVLKALLLIGQTYVEGQSRKRAAVRQTRSSFSTGLWALLHADDQLYGGSHHAIILRNFERRGITASNSVSAIAVASTPAPPDLQKGFTEEHVTGLLKHVKPEDIPPIRDLHTFQSLSSYFRGLEEPPPSLVAGGDVMLGGRMRKLIAAQGPDFAFDAVRPLLQQAPIVLVNLEGPFARKAIKADRNYSYRVNPRLAHAALRAGITVMTLANNHLLDCGRDGVMETLEALAQAGIAALGAGVNREAAHQPVIRDAFGCRVGLLGYYWNRRCAATDSLAGGAMDTHETLAADIGRLRRLVDRVVVTFHWGVPYVAEPSEADRRKARFAIDCGADAVIGHHPHVLQPVEIYRGRPIFYSVGNFAFGSGNSRAEGMLVALRFEESSTTAHIYPLYVKNRDVRVNYQPKILRGPSARHVLSRLSRQSGASADAMAIQDDRGVIVLEAARVDRVGLGGAYA